jgi:hypothetical protein
MVIRRPHPPPTTVALDEDFDAVTVEEGSTIYAGNGQRYIYRQLDSEVDAVKRMTLHRADSPEHDNLGLRLGEMDHALSDLNIGNGKVTITSMESSPKGSGLVADGTRAEKSTEDKDLGPTVTTANIGDRDGTQISYEEFYSSDMVIEPLTRANRKSSYHKIDPRRSNGEPKSEGSGAQGMGSRRVSMDRKTVSMKNIPNKRSY